MDEPVDRAETPATDPSPDADVALLEAAAAELEEIETALAKLDGRETDGTR